MVDKRIAGLVLTALAIGLLLEGALSRDWWTLRKPDEQVVIEMGMDNSRVCIAAKCRTLPHSRIASVLGGLNNRVWLMAGAAADWGAWVTAAILLVSGLLAWLRRSIPGVLLAQVTAVLCGLLVLWAALYVGLFPRHLDASVVRGHSPITYFLGALCGIAGSVLLAVGGEQESTPSLDEVFD